MEFCNDDDLALMPMSECNVLAYIGCLKEQKRAGTRLVTSTSLPQYLSAFHMMHKMYTGQPSSPFPFLYFAVRVYKKWKEEKFSTEVVRCGESAKMLQKVWYQGMCITDMTYLIDYALICFTFSFNGLLESSIISLPLRRFESKFFFRCTV